MELPFGKYDGKARNGKLDREKTVRRFVPARPAGNLSRGLRKSAGEVLSFSLSLSFTESIYIHELFYVGTIIRRENFSLQKNRMAIYDDM